jgi:hypothetical protein
LAYISQCAVIEYEARSCGCGNRAWNPNTVYYVIKSIIEIKWYVIFVMDG